MIATIPNLLSALRGPLALLFISENSTLRMAAVVLAMATDALDGFLARRNGQSSQFGAFLDPLMDKFFMVFVLTILLMEHDLLPWQMATLLSRDLAVAVFGLYLGFTGRWGQYKLHSIWAGKISTTFQFLVLIALLNGWVLPNYVFFSFVLLGIFAWIELYIPLAREKTQRT